MPTPMIEFLREETERFEKFLNDNHFKFYDSGDEIDEMKDRLNELLKEEEEAYPFKVMNG